MLLLSKLDESLSLALNGRDPLGTQAIWQWRARDIVPSLTAASRQAEGFQLLLTALAWWPDFAKRFGRPTMDLTNYFLLVEQAFARAFKTLGDLDSWPLPGKRRLSGNDLGIWIGLDPKRHLLIDSPLANGTWGIYRGPLMNAGLIDTENLICDSRFEEVIRRDTRVMEDLFPHLNNALKANDGHDEVVARLKSKAIVEKLADVLRKLPLKAKLKEKLVSPADFPITGDLAEFALIGPEKETPENLIRRSLHHFPKWRKPLTDVVHCERYLAALDGTFEELCAAVLAGEADPGSQLTVDIAQLANAQKNFASSGAYKGLAEVRHRQLLTAPMRDAKSLAAFLVEHHRAVSAARTAAPWLIETDNGRLQCQVEVHKPSAKELHPATAWRNSYYLDSLRTLAERVSRMKLR